jgi:hypothetical protein
VLDRGLVVDRCIVDQDVEAVELCGCGRDGLIDSDRVAEVCNVNGD